MNSLGTVIDFPGPSIASLSLDEIEQVDGGLHPALIVAAAGGGFALGVVVGVGLIYLAMHM